MQLYRLVQARATGRITQAECDQHTHFYLGLNMLNGRSDNPLTRRLWAGVRLPLGYVLCNGWYKHISTVAKYGKRNPQGKDITLGPNHAPATFAIAQGD